MRLAEDAGLMVGINAGSPSAWLHVIGTTQQLRIGYNTSNYWSSTISSTGGLTMQGVGTGGALTISPTSGQNINLTLSGTGDFAVNTNHLYVDTSTGNVGVGTATPNEKLTVAGNTFVTGGLGIGATNTAAGTIQLGSNGSNGAPSIGWETTGFYKTAGNSVVFTSSGANATTFTAGGGISTLGNVAGGSGTVSAPSHTFTAESSLGMWRAGTNILAFSTASSERLRIDANGNVGVGSTTPNEKLTVSGNISATNIYSGNIVYNTGDQSIAGDKTFTDDLICNGQITAPNQTDTTGNSVLTRSLADARYISNVGLLSLASITLVDVAMGFASQAINTTLNQPASTGATGLRLTTTVGMVVGATIATNIFTGIPHNTYITAIDAAAVSPLPNVTISAPLIADIPSGQVINTVVVAGGSATSSGRSMFASTSTTLGSESTLLFGGFNPSPFVYPGEVSSGSSGINFNRKTYFGFKITTAHGTNNGPNAGADGWVRMGCSRQYRKYGAPEAPNKAVGIWRSAGSYYAWVMDGTTLNIGATPIFTTISGLNPVTLVEITGDGLGNFTFHINGVAIQTLTGGPTGQSGQEGTQFALCVRNLTGGASSNCTMSIVNGQFIFTYLE
jgi:hypothetical protein